MSQSLRQSELFSGQDWQVLYQAFTQINFNASDPRSINKALRDYIAANYAEDFSDWIESSEFIAIIDLLSYLAGTLAFKSDINARENFLETAEARESVLRLARMLSYTPRRNYPARGLLKLKEIETNDDVYDATGVNLQGRGIQWNNTDDPDWFERIVLILNSAFLPTNSFGVPLKSIASASSRTQLYGLNARFGSSDLRFQTLVQGTAMDFELFNPDISEDAGFLERTPDLDAPMHCVYRADGNGNASPNTGFFFTFKQGRLQYQDFIIDNPVENQLIDVNTDNINETDVWVQTLNDNGSTRFTWEKVPAIFSDNITFNSIDAKVRNIFSVVTRDRDQISLRFSDGRFGAAPVGRMRTWTRVSNGYQYQIRPSEMENVKVSIPYLNRRGVARTLTLTLSLEESISNATTRETDEQIRRRAPQVYAAQNRMVSGEDYNTFPLQSNQAAKIKAVTRIYSGHSRFLDMNDPTGSYQDLSVFSDDGIFYKERIKPYAEVPLTDNKTPIELMTNFIRPFLKSEEVTNVVLDYLYRLVRGGTLPAPVNMVWTKANDATTASSGWFSTNSVYLRPGATLLMKHGATSHWVNVVSLISDPTIPVGDGIRGPVVLSESIPSDATVTAIVPAYLSTINNETATQIERRLQSNLSFSLWYDYAPADGETFWVMRNPESIDKQPQVIGTTLKVMVVDFLSESLWRFLCPGIRYVFESVKGVRFYFDGHKSVDATTGRRHEDLVRVLKQNVDLRTGLGLGRDFDLKLTKTITYADGYADPRRVAVRFSDRDEDGYPDDPDTYYRLCSDEALNSLLFWVRDADGLYVPYNEMVVYEAEEDRANSLAAVNVTPGTVAFQIESTTKPETFWVRTETGWEHLYRGFRFARGRGPNVARTWVKKGGTLATTPQGSQINFHWKHFAPADHRVDPAKTNIIDMFVLTSEYDFLVRQWIRNGVLPADKPEPPSELSLRLAFGDFETYKMFSDEIVWRPVKYKYLFGTGADASLRATFKVVKLPTSKLSDGEIKAGVVNAINAYFSSEFWDFGETFYFTELTAYIHKELSTSIASCVIVPTSQEGAFGDAFEVRCRSDEIFISTATVADVTMISSNTPTNLRIR